MDSNSTGYGWVGSGDNGINAYGSNAGGYFHGPSAARLMWGPATTGSTPLAVPPVGTFTGRPAATPMSLRPLRDFSLRQHHGGYFKDANGSGYANVGVSENGIEAYGNTAGGYFVDANSGGATYAYAGYGNYGIYASGPTEGGHFLGPPVNWAAVATSTYKIQGTGTVSFVQNHPTDKDKVIVYACPEGDEVATYTRGTAKLVNGEARVKLGETFQWVTNPDLGLTAHLTPRGEAVALAVESLSTTELVVRGPKGGPSNLTFDYLVYGLRIGFEESSIVQEKQRESYIPSFHDHAERYSKFPEMRAFNSLERFKTMESLVRGVSPASIDTSRSKH